MNNNQNTLSTNNEISVVPFVSYANADVQKLDNLRDNRKKLVFIDELM